MMRLGTRTYYRHNYSFQFILAMHPTHEKVATSTPVRRVMYGIPHRTIHHHRIHNLWLLMMIRMLFEISIDWFF